MEYRGREVPLLDGWVTLPEVAEIMGVTKQYIHKLVFEQDQFQTLHAIGLKPLYIVRRVEAELFAERRRALALARVVKKLNADTVVVDH